MDKYPSFQFYPSDWFDVRVMRMSYEAQGVYMRLLCFMWRDSNDQCSIEAEPSMLARILGLDEAATKRILGEIQRKDDPIFQLSSGRFVSKRLHRIKAQLDALRHTRSKAGSKGAASRWQDDGNAHGKSMAKEDRREKTEDRRPKGEDRSQEEGGAGGTGPIAVLQNALPPKPDPQAPPRICKKARDFITNFKNEISRHKMLEFIGALENEPTVTDPRIIQVVKELWNLREGLVMEGDALPADRLFNYALSETMKKGVRTTAYVATVLRNAIMKHRDGVKIG